MVWILIFIFSQSFSQFFYFIFFLHFLQFLLAQITAHKNVTKYISEWIKLILSFWNGPTKVKTLTCLKFYELALLEVLHICDFCSMQPDCSTCLPFIQKHVFCLTAEFLFSYFKCIQVPIQAPYYPFLPLWIKKRKSRINLNLFFLCFLFYKA